MSAAPTSFYTAKNASKRQASRWHNVVMANSEHLAKLKEGVEAWNRWRAEHPTVAPDISKEDIGLTLLLGANLSEADLSKENVDRTLHECMSLKGANLSGTNLTGSNLSGADLTDTFFENANLSQANLDGVSLGKAFLGRANLNRASINGAYLHWADLTLTDLSQAELRKTDLRGANLRFAILNMADLTGASVGYTNFANVDLSGVKGLDTLEHSRPSSIGIDTIYRSKGKIPHIFLRGAGVPENFIEYMASLVGTGIEFYSLFISYSTQDHEFAERLYADLQAKGVRCWFAPHKLKSGKKVHKQIDEAIRVYDKLLLILSPDSMGSEWVRTEIAIARKREVDQKREVLFPIGLCPFETIRKWEYFDSDIGKDSAREIREFHIPDFSNWKDHDAYKLAFDRLLDDLHGKSDPPTA
jgi:uncharacterized protein YjbI with pentapeptide repeats